MQKGQTIIELVVVIAIASLLIAALIGLAFRSNSSATFSKQSGQASKLASEAIEIIKSMRVSSATTITLSTFTVLNAQPKHFNELFGFNVLDEQPSNPLGNGKYGHLFHLHPPTDPHGPETNPNNFIGRWHFDTNAPSFPEPEACPEHIWNQQLTQDNVVFKRCIFVADTVISEGGKSECNEAGTDDWQRIKQITVTVSWDSTSGTHEQLATTCLTRG